MPLQPLSHPARARLNQIRTDLSVGQLAEAMVRWQFRRDDNPGALWVPMCVPIKATGGEDSPEPATSSPDELDQEAFRDRARLIRQAIAHQLRIVDPTQIDQITYTQTADQAWFLGPRPGMTMDSAIGAACSTDEVARHYIRLVLLKELVAQAALDAQDVFIQSGFGPLVYLMVAQKRVDYLHMFEVDFQVVERSGAAVITCLIHYKVFQHLGRECAPGADPALHNRPLDVGEGVLLDVARINPRHFREVDARRSPPAGISLQVGKMRSSRLYFLNLATEFALSVLKQVTPSAAYGVFEATHVVEAGYIPLDDLARLCRPLEVVAPFGGQDDLVGAVAQRLTQWADYIGPHTVGTRKVVFQAPQVRCVDVGGNPNNDAALTPPPSAEVNRLFLNDPNLSREEAEENAEGSAWVVPMSGRIGDQAVRVRPDVAYERLSEGAWRADRYTTCKFAQVINKSEVAYAIQGLDISLPAISRLQLLKVSVADVKAEVPGARKRLADETVVREALKRCLVELSLKECLIGAKPLPIRSLRGQGAAWDASYTLIATRVIRLSRRNRKQLVSAVDIDVCDGEIHVRRVRRTAWARASVEAAGMCFDFPFIQGPSKDGQAGKIRDGQFWMLDRSSGQRLAAWRGDFVPKIVLNDRYATIESALRDQESVHASRDDQEFKYYSKGQSANLLPYYMSMTQAPSAGPERAGAKVAIQDCGPYVRVFVPPAASLAGARSSLSNLRDVMVYQSDGSPVETGLLEHRLVVAYLHAMTTGILVGGGNSKMSVFEKLAKMALLN